MRSNDMCLSGGRVDCYPPKYLFNCMRGGFVIVEVVSWGKTRALLEKGVTSDYQPSITTTYQNLILPRE